MLKGHAPGTILVIDDEERNLRLIRRILEMEGYQTLTATDGHRGLELLRSERPELVLLDVMMPGLDGHAVCALIKADPDVGSVPVLFVTALHDDSQQVKCLDVGGDDFVTKPVDPAVLLARVRTHLRVKRLHDRVAQSRDELREKNERLEALERMRDDLVHMLVHDLKSPIGALSLTVELLRARHPLPSNSDRDSFDNIGDIAIRLELIVRNILDVAKIEEARLRPRLVEVDVAATVDSSLRQVRLLGAHDAQTVRVTITGKVGRFAFDPGLIGRVLENLVANALKVSDHGAEVEVDITLETNQLVIAVADRGPGVAPELRNSIFEKFRGDEHPQRFANHGLGLTFCKLAVEAHGGEIAALSRPGSGSIFRFSLPAGGVAGGAKEDLREPAQVS